MRIYTFAFCSKYMKLQASNSDEILFLPRDFEQYILGQSIPSGLHVRMDLEKGGRWAKLMEVEKSEAKSLMPVDAPEDAKE